MGHHAHPTPNTGRALWISAGLTGGYFVIELTAAILIGSVAVLSDAFHTFSAVGGVLIAITAARYASRPATSERTLGYLRSEIFGAFVNGFFLLGMAALVLFMGVRRLQSPTELSTTPMLLVAAGGIVTELISLALLYEAQKTSLNIRGAYWHVVQTFVGSLIIIVAAVVIRLTGFLEIDSLLGMAFGLVLLWASHGIIKSSVDIFLEAAPPEIDLHGLKQELDALPGVRSAHHMHAWTIASQRTIFSAHVLVDADHPADLLRRITDGLRDQHGVYFSTVQLELEYDDEGAEEIEFLREAPSHESHVS